MNKRKQPQPQINQKQLKDFLENYDRAALIGALNTLENNTAWDLFKSYAHYVQRTYEVEALDKIGIDGQDKRAAYASGYAKCAEDMPEDFLKGLVNTLRNVNPVIENVRPEE